MIYVLKSPSGKLIECTIGVSYDDTWGKSFDFLWFKWSPKTRQKLWKEWDKSIAYARKAGWEIVTARIAEVDAP